MTIRTPDERIKQTLGDLLFQLAIAQSTIEEQKAMIDKLQAEKPVQTAVETNPPPPKSE